MFRSRGLVFAPFHAHTGRRWCSAADAIPVTAAFDARRVPDDELRKQLKAGPWPTSRIRNFSIIAHVDHGKTTLSDAILRRTNVVQASEMAGVGKDAVFMDKLQVERERGITIKAQTATMFVKHPESKEEYMLNLIDTPGHIDFAYEVARSLTASEGAVLLVDASQGVQAQTMAHFYYALDTDITMIPALTKCDVVLTDDHVNKVAAMVEDATGFLNHEITRTSARSNLGLEAILRRVMDQVPAPKGKPDSPLRAYLFDAWFGPHTRRTERPGTVHHDDVQTVLCAVRVVDGVIRRGDIVTLMHADRKSEGGGVREYQVVDCGILHPNPVSTDVLYAGMVGYVDLNMQTRREDSVGDTLCRAGDMAQLQPVAPFKPLRPVIFATLHPNDGESFETMRAAVDKLLINDPAVTATTVKCEAFGPGLLLGFFGTLHQSVFEQRLQAEHNVDVVITPPQVFYKYRDEKGELHDLTAATWVDKGSKGVTELLEPVVTATVVCRESDFNEINRVTVTGFRGEMLETQIIDGGRMSVKYKIPLAELIQGLMTRVMQISRGFASLDYDEPKYEPADLVKVDVVINKKVIPALSTVVVKQDATAVGKRLVAALREHIPSVQVNLPVQAVINGKVIARETVSARRKDVLAKIHAGDFSRKAKKLADQKKGKARMAEKVLGQFTLDSDTLEIVMGASRLGPGGSP